jgi:hypothetical protein
MKLSRLARLTHRWLSYVIALQVLAWVIGGVLFAWLPFQPWVKAGDFASPPAPRLEARDGDALLTGLQRLPPGTALRSAASVAGPDGALWKLTRQDAPTLWLRVDGRPHVPPDAATIERFAATIYRGPGKQAGPATQLSEVPARLGLVQETGGRGKLWRVAFDDAQRTRLYFDDTSGEFVTARTEAWVWYDLLWRLHIMDYGGGEDFNNSLLRAAAPLALLLVLAGAILTVQAAWRARASKTPQRPRAGR